MKKNKLAVVGVGNILMQDDGLGVRALELLRESGPFPESVLFVDGGTIGMGLSSLVSSCERLLILDAVHLGNAPGSVYRFSLPDYRILRGKRASAHEVGILDLLALCELQGCAPEETVIVGMEPKVFGDWGVDLSDEVVRAMPTLLETATSALLQLRRCLEPPTA